MTTAVNLARLNLNLLIAFDALMLERNVSRAARRIGLSQPAMSNALRRLRTALGDELFLRTGREMMPTAAAIELAQTVGPALGEIRAALQSQLSFDPQVSKRSFVLGLPDIVSVGLLPELSRLLRSQAPGVNVEVVDVGPDEGFELVLTGRADLAFGVSVPSHGEVSQQHLGDFAYVVVADARNERVRDGRLTIADIAELPHVSFAPMSDIAEIDARLAQHGLKRRIAISVPHGLSVARAVAGTDLIAFMEPDVIAVSGDLGLVVVPDPLDLPGRRVDLIWHRRHDHDASHEWLRQQVARLMAERGVAFA